MSTDERNGGCEGERAGERAGEHAGEHAGERDADRGEKRALDPGPDRGPARGREPDSERRARFDEIARSHTGRLVAGLARRLGARHLELAEDAVHEALLLAWERWAVDGEPPVPAAWLARAARQRALDALRRERLEGADEIERLARHTAAMEHGSGDDVQVEREELGLFFALAHPSLVPEARVALALASLCGLTTPEIARGLLATEDAVAQRLVRARRRILEEGIALEMPGEREIERRLPSVLDTLELLFLEGYAAHAGEHLMRPDVQRDALRLGEALVRDEITDTPESRALLARMSFQSARTRARVDEHGDLVTLARQDRTLWDQARIARGFQHFALSLTREVTARHAEAAIEAVHVAAPTFAETDWPAIVEAYDDLLALRPSALARLNRAVATAHVSGHATALAEVDAAAGAPELARHPMLHAVRAQLLWALERRAEAAVALRAALDLPLSDPERRLLARRLVACENGATPDEF